MMPCGAVLVFYISIHTLRMEGDRSARVLDFIGIISIHTLRMEGDDNLFIFKFQFDISIHTLRMEGDCWGQQL